MESNSGDRRSINSEPPIIEGVIRGTGGRRVGSTSVDIVNNINGPKVRELRLERGWTQEDLGEHADLSRATVSLIETKRGFRVSRMSFDFLAHALSVSPELLLAVNNDPSTKAELLRELKTLLDRASGMVSQLIDLKDK